MLLSTILCKKLFCLTDLLTVFWVLYKFTPQTHVMLLMWNYENQTSLLSLAVRESCLLCPHAILHCDASSCPWWIFRDPILLWHDLLNKGSDFCAEAVEDTFRQSAVTLSLYLSRTLDAVIFIIVCYVAARVSILLRNNASWLTSVISGGHFWTRFALQPAVQRDSDISSR